MPPTSKITHFAIFGERCSGTNHASAWIAKNTGLIERKDGGWKHGAMNLAVLKSGPPTLCVLVTRNLPDWLRSLHLQPHHFGPEMRGLPFEQFIKRSARSIWDHQMGVLPKSAKFGTAIETEQHKGKPYANLMRLRLHKHRAWLRQMEELPDALPLRHEDLMAQPQHTMSRLLDACGLPQRADTIPISTYKGREQDPGFQARKYMPIGPAAREYILEQVDWEIEARLGYDTRADLEAAAAIDGHVDWDLLRESLADRPELLAMLDHIACKLRDQEDEVRHTEQLAISQRKYLKSLFHAIEQARPTLFPWKRGRLTSGN